MIRLRPVLCRASLMAASIVSEPIQGEGGYNIPPKEFLPALRQLCDDHGILMVADEIQSGIGRTGKWWACQQMWIKSAACF